MTRLLQPQSHDLLLLQSLEDSPGDGGSRSGVLACDEVTVDDDLGLPRFLLGEQTAELLDAVLWKEGDFLATVASVRV